MAGTARSLLAFRLELHIERLLPLTPANLGLFSPHSNVQADACLHCLGHCSNKMASPAFMGSYYNCFSSPEHIESGWRNGAGVRRDYYTVWLFQERKAPGQWVLQGYFS